MAYRRRQQTTATATSSSNFSSTNPSPISSHRHRSHEDFVDVDVDLDVDHSSNSTVLAAKAIRASSAAHRDSSLSSAYAFNHPSPSPSSPSPSPSSLSSKDPKPDHEYTSMNTLNESKKGFWSNLARKAKSIIEDDLGPPSPNQPPDSSAKAAHWSPHSTSEPKTPYSSRESSRKAENPPTLQKGLSAISSSLNYIGNAVEEGLTIVENRTAGIIQETRKHIRKKPNGAAGQNQPTTTRSGSWQQPQMQTHKQSPHMETDQELQLKASRDVAMAMAAKAKLLLRELKTVKADFAFAKERCAQLEEENKILRENRERGENLEDDDLIRLQLETLLAEKARLAHENSVYARENRFLREVVEYHQLTMQDVVYFDEGSEEVTEVYPIKVVTNTHPVPIMSVPPEASFDTTLPITRDILPHPVPPPALLEVPQTTGPHHSYGPTSTAIDTRKLPNPSV